MPEFIGALAFLAGMVGALLGLLVTGIGLLVDKWMKRG